MPQVIECTDTKICTLDQCLAAITREGFEPEDDASLTHAALWLRRLGNDRSFLADIVLNQLKARHREQDVDASGYGPQVIMLSQPQGEFFMRANIWPSQAEHAFRASGGASFVYGLPHDHNFHFLTLGYFGPGYWSDYYEYAYEAVQGWSGEPAGLRFVERSRLEEGKLQLYRAHLDVHAQLPPDELSVSLNIMHMSAVQSWHDQYVFDTDGDTIVRIANPASSEVFLRMAVGMGGAEARDLAQHFAHHHPSDRMRMTAWDAQAGSVADKGSRDAIWREAEISGSRMVRKMAKLRRAEIA